MYGVSIGYPGHTFNIVTQRMRWHCAQEGIGSILVPLLSKEQFYEAFYEMRKLDVRSLLILVDMHYSVIITIAVASLYKI
jgi:hypothetical protein